MCAVIVQFLFITMVMMFFLPWLPIFRMHEFVICLANFSICGILFARLQKLNQDWKLE